MLETMIGNTEVLLNTDFITTRDRLSSHAEKVVYTGAIDEFFNYQFGKLNYRSLRFETEILNQENFQGNAVVNYTEREIPFTRIVEHKHFNPIKINKTVISREYPIEWEVGKEPYYPINDIQNNNLYERYRQLAKMRSNLIFGGRLGSYRYYNMDEIIEAALKIADIEFSVH